MWDELFRQKEADELARVRRQTMEERFREGVELSTLARKMWLARPDREQAEEVLRREELEEHLAQLRLPVLPDA